MHYIWVLKTHISISIEILWEMNNSSVYPICDRDINISWVPTIMEYIFGVIGNIIALVLLWINRRDHQWKSFYKLFTGLALTDLLGVFLVFPFATYRYVSHFTWCFPEPLCRFVSFVFMDAHISSAMLICAMSIDRYLNLVRPHWFQSRHEGRKYTLVLLGIWVAGSLISMLHLVGVGDSELFYPGSWCYFDFVRDTTGNRVMSYIYSVFGFFIVLVTILANVLTMCRICWDPITGGILLDLRQVSGLEDSHVMIFIIAVTIVFFILWTPLLVDVFLHAAGIRRANESLELWLIRMTVLNSILDPWLYIVLRRESIHKIGELRQYCCSWKKNNVESDENVRLIRSTEIGRNTRVNYSCISDHED